MNNFRRIFILSIIIISNIAIPQTSNNPLSINSMTLLGENIFVGGNYGVFSSSNNGANWNKVNNGLTDSIVVSLAVNGTNLFAATAANGVFRSKDNGLNWTPVNNNLNYTNLMDLDSSENKIYALSNNYIYFSGDNGDNWDTISTSTISWHPFYWRLLKVFKGNIFIYGTWNSYSHEESVYRSTNNGVSWDNVTHELNTGYPYTTINSMTISHDTLFALEAGWSHGNDIYYTTNLGMNWTSFFTNGPITSIIKHNNYIFASMGHFEFDNGNVIRSSDNGVTWNSTSLELSYRIIQFLTKGDYIFANTKQHGVYLTLDEGAHWNPVGNGLPINDIKETSSKIPTDYLLSQNFPNPFNPETSIQYKLMSECIVKLTVFNSIGVQITELANKVQPKGEYDVIFNAKNLSSGVYFYSVKAIPIDGKREFNAVKKMIIMK